MATKKGKTTTVVTTTKVEPQIDPETAEGTTPTLLDLVEELVEAGWCFDVGKSGSDPEPYVSAFYRYRQAEQRNYAKGGSFAEAIKAAAVLAQKEGT